MPERPKNPKKPTGEGPEEAPKPHRGTRRLPKHFEDLATGEETRVRAPRRPPQGLHEERQRVVIRGVNNRDARLVFDARVAELAQATSDEERALRLFEAQQLAIWRARAITGFDAFAEDVVGLPRERARALAEAGAQVAQLPLATLPERQIALWLRTEAAVREHAPSGSVRIVGNDERAVVEVRVPVEPAHAAVSALAGVGRQAAGLGRHLDRPPGQSPRDADARERPSRGHVRGPDRGPDRGPNRGPHPEDRGGQRRDKPRRGPGPDPRAQHGRAAPSRGRRPPPRKG